MKATYPTIFITGASRTGTTLVARMLNKSPRIALYPQETHAFPLLWTRGGKPALPVTVQTPEAFAAYLAKKFPLVNISWRHPDHQPALDAFIQGLKADRYFPGSASHLLKYILDKQQALKPGMITGEKTPAHIYYYRAIDKSFERPKFIVTIRDPRATALSELVKKNIPHLKLAAFNLLTFIVRWNSVYMVYERMLRELGPERVLLVKYEDLVADPEPVARQLAAFAGVEFDAAMLEVGVFNSSFGDKFQTDKNFNTENIDRWRTELDPKLLAVIEKHCGALMRRYGYAPVSELPDDLNLVQKLKMHAGYAVLRFDPAWFHHINRNKNYYPVI